MCLHKFEVHIRVYKIIMFRNFENVETRFKIPCISKAFNEKYMYDFGNKDQE